MKPGTFARTGAVVGALVGWRYAGAYASIPWHLLCAWLGMLVVAWIGVFIEDGIP
jgi:hypothetical protein